ncbi:MAG: hypothetical protein LBK13_00160 [Spirochaetales bacterium]|jgi:hypothetical protein|nr:hypothetical protein [Spirochaetales bacterium]
MQILWAFRYNPWRAHQRTAAQNQFPELPWQFSGQLIAVQQLAAYNHAAAILPVPK